MEIYEDKIVLIPIKKRKLKMAQKRMFDKRIIEIDKFIDMPMSAKALYFLFRDVC